MIKDHINRVLAAAFTQIGFLFVRGDNQETPAMGLPTVTDAATGALLLEGIDRCDTQKTKIPVRTNGQCTDIVPTSILSV
jgi:hypothetical protein